MPMQYTQHDTDLSFSAQLQLESGRIEFQFPPRVLSDGRRGSWSEGELRGTEPIAVFNTSSAREISLSWYYIADGGKWPASKIAAQVRAIRGYFAQIRATGDTRKLAVKFKLWQIGGKNPITCRIMGIDVKHSPTLVGNSQEAYPLRTDITVELRIWTKGGGSEQVQQLPILEAKEPEEWY